MRSLNVTDTENAPRVLSKYSAIVRACDAIEAVGIAAWAAWTAIQNHTAQEFARRRGTTKIIGDFLCTALT